MVLETAEIRYLFGFSLPWTTERAKNKTDTAHIVANVTCIVSSLYTGDEHWPMLSVSDYASAFISCLIDITDNLRNKGLKRQLTTMRIPGHDRHAQR